MRGRVHARQPAFVVGGRDRDYIELLVLEAGSIELRVLAAVVAWAGRGEVELGSVIPAMA